MNCITPDCEGECETTFCDKCVEELPITRRVSIYKNLKKVTRYEQSLL